MMDNEYLVKSTKRVYDECELSQSRGNGASVGKALITNFNELLEEHKEHYPNNSIIQSLDPVSTSGMHGSAHPNDVQEVKMNTLKLADCLNLDTNDFRNPPSSDSMNVINVSQNQSVDQTVTVDMLVEQVNNLSLSSADKDELIDVVEEYQDEVRSEDTDESKLQRLYQESYDYSQDVAAKLAIFALERGVTGIIPL
jgi:hypothetical protein